MRAYYLTDTGKIRDHNEDSVTILKNNNNEYLLLVADGMGGHRKGEIASSIAITHIGKRFNKTPSLGTKIDAVNWLNNNISEINKEILEYAKTHDDSTGMGTTIVIALYTKDYLIFGNIGDSSGYILKDQKLHKVTKDHTLVNLLIDAGNISEEDAKTHPKKNVLMKALGVGEVPELDIFDVETPFDAILLCSDGLTNMLTLEQMERIINDISLSTDEKVKKLIIKSNARGGTDNISIALLEKDDM